MNNHKNSTDKAAIDEMIAATEAWKTAMATAQRKVKSMGLSLDLDRAYDGYQIAMDQLEACKKVA